MIPTGLPTVSKFLFSVQSQAWNRQEGDTGAIHSGSEKESPSAVLT
jgi:hypothetical protein